MTAGAAIGGGPACGLFESDPEQDNDTWTHVGSSTDYEMSRIIIGMLVTLCCYTAGMLLMLRLNLEQEHLEHIAVI